MPDMEKVTEHLNDCLEASRRDNTWVFVRKDIVVDALALLKEQEAVKPLFSHQMKYFVCPKCSLVLDEGRDDYCPSCGARIAWDEYYIDEESEDA